jgi:precorrin-6A/cobalt-precorrin-6A reductase
MRVLLLGGTSEASALARRLAERPGIDLVVSLAGRTSHPLPLPGEVRIGGFGGPEGLATYLRETGVDVLVDATHPFAAHMPHHAAEACTTTGVPRLRLLRPEWPEVPGDRWHRVPDLPAAADELAAIGAERVFVTTGRMELEPYTKLSGVWFLLRSVEPPEPLPFPDAEVILDRGPFDEDAERDLMGRHRIDALVTKNSGGPAGAKLAAARSLGIPVVIVDRPPAPEGPTVETVDQAEAWVAAHR